jgi:hypothetical protein
MRPSCRLARCFLFGSRDLWFEVPLPFFLRDAVGGLGLERRVVGAFLAIYIIVYGQMQSYTPQLVIGPLGQTPPNKYVAVIWAAFLVPITLGIGLAVTISPAFLERDLSAMLGLLIGGIATFAIIFAVNSSVHSYLVVRYAAGDKVGLKSGYWSARVSDQVGRFGERALCARTRAVGSALASIALALLTRVCVHVRAHLHRLPRVQVATDVGFYYMANAVGRLIGTLTSGALYSYAATSPSLGFAACMWASSAFCVLSSVIVSLCDDDKAGLRCGPCACMLAQTADDEEEAKPQAA